MPRVKRWFNVSQTINRDPEVRELKREFGLTGFSMWLEVLSETDGVTEGVWKGSETDIRRVLAGVCESNTRGSARLLQWVTDRGWIVWLSGSEIGSRRDLKVVNHAKYHPIKEDKKLPEGKPKDFLPSFLPIPSLPSVDIKIPLKRKLTTLFPDGFELSESVRTWALGRGVDPDEEFEAFKDFHISKANRFADWGRAFKNWVRNSKKFNSSPKKSRAEEAREKTYQMLNRKVENG